MGRQTCWLTRGGDSTPNNLQPLSKQRRVGEWEALGLVPMDESLGS